MDILHGEGLRLNFVILDLEWNTAFDHRQKGFVNEIIEFGAVKLDNALRPIGTYQQLVRTRLTRKLTSKVEDLTHLTLQELRHGIRFPQALEEFGRFVGKDTLLMTWSTTDIRVLLENCSAFTQFKTIPFLERYADLQWYVQEALGLGHRNQVGLGAVAEQLGLSCEGIELHRALDDSLLSAEVLRRCYRPELLEGMIQDARDTRFYDRLCFKSYYIIDIKSPLIRPDDLRMPCEECGLFARRVSKWKNHHKGFCADFHCRHCGRRFHGRIQFKKRFDDVEIKRTQRPILEEQSAPAPQDRPDLPAVQASSDSAASL